MSATRPDDSGRRRALSTALLVGIFAAIVYLLGLQISFEAGSVMVRSVTLAAQVLRVTWSPQVGVHGLELGDRDATRLSPWRWQG